MKWRLRAGPLALVAALVVGLFAVTGAGATAGDPEPTSIVEVLVADENELARLVDKNFDLDHNLRETADGFVVNAVVTPSELNRLRKLGFTVGETLQGPGDLDDVLEERSSINATKARSAAAQIQLMEAENVNLKVLRADWFTSTGNSQLSVEALHADGADSSVTLQLEWDSGPGTEMGSGGSISLQRFVDAGVYMYHRRQTSVPVQPDMIRVTASTGDVVTAKVTEWLPPDDRPVKDRYEDFIDAYMDPTEAYTRLNQLAEEFPHLAEIRNLPFKTNGYRRKAQALIEPPQPKVVIDSGSAAGDYEAVAASFGPDAPVAGIPGDVVLVNDGSSSPTEGCNALVGFPAGAVALIDRGSCAFTQKVGNAQAAGAAAVIVANNVPGSPFAMGGGGGGITIPSVMISLDDGAAIKAGLPATGSVHGSPPSSSSNLVVVESLAWGHEGGNDVVVEVVDPGTPNATLAVGVMGSTVRVSLATDGAGEPVSTAAEVVDALNANAGSVLRAWTYRGSSGGGVVSDGTFQLSDFLQAPDYVLREPFQTQALVIGRHARDGSKTGVLAYAQEHAREWLNPLITLETAERLLRNYAHDGRVKQLLRNLEIWVIPSLNPDGGHFSFYDDNGQRRNMTNYCGPEDSDPGRRNDWGVDNNRNYDFGSMFDGYSGASSNCRSDVFAGPSELSEPENRNLTWVVDNHPNIRFAMNLHSSGNYFMWSPGAYAVPGRITLPRPDPGVEAYFYQASSRILTAIKRYRGLSVTPARTGPIADVLYSAAGNSGDRLYYVNDIFAWNFETGSSFQPQWEQAHAAVMEFSNGLEELMRVAYDWSRDGRPPRSRLLPGGGKYQSGPVELEFVTPSEPAIVYYTLDGSRPTFENALRLESQGPRQGAAPLVIDETTTVNWFSVDMAGNVEKKYDPSNPSSMNFRSETVTILD